MGMFDIVYNLDKTKKQKYSGLEFITEEHKPSSLST